MNKLSNRVLTSLSFQRSAPLASTAEPVSLQKPAHALAVGEEFSVKVVSCWVFPLSRVLKLGLRPL